MESGYVLGFTNRTFREFVVWSTGRDIFDCRYDYGSGSKANRLRAFWRTEDDATVGKLLKDLIEYSDHRGEQREMCLLIAFRLLNSASSAPDRKDPLIPKESEIPARLRGLHDQFEGLAREPDRNLAGLALEQLLYQLFELYGLRPRQPFRVVGEQIDGSFHLDGATYLLEAKWEKDPLPEAPLLVFRGKIEGKSSFTRGVMIALNGISKPAREAITRGKPPSFFVMDGYDLLQILNESAPLPEFLRRRVRLLAEEGKVCASFNEVFPQTQNP